MRKKDRVEVRQAVADPKAKERTLFPGCRLGVSLAIFGALFFSVVPVVAFAEEPNESDIQSPDVTVTVDNSDVIDKINSLQIDLELNQQETMQEQQKQTEELQKISETLEVGEDKTETDLLKSIDKSLLQIVGNTAGDEMAEQTALRAGGTTAFVAYANVSPTGTYASYAAGVVPKVRYDEHYVFLQDTSSSYVIVWGPLTIDDANTFGGEGCRWSRWYWAGSSDGYVMETGGGNVSITTNGKTVLSDLGSYPMLLGVTDQGRKEVGLYVVTAVCVFCFASVWTWLLRTRSSVVAE